MNAEKLLELVDTLNANRKVAIEQDFAQSSKQSNNLIDLFNDLNESTDKFLDEVIEGDYDDSTLSDFLIAQREKISNLAVLIGLPPTSFWKIADNDGTENRT